ncbi:uncharacterized protein LOC106080034 isoform X2 [Biomphalaria glabrata]|uniref:Uncharacterized protein LOC106080034 isoform X2 n=1 Tax=Biomphalaria glabrata TaxID=6526 RepID=A0A9W3A075_BIOGL|nr:uncharacterized protein LOC106080034 isoform X2 [Biomphalaria glabrata]
MHGQRTYSLRKHNEISKAALNQQKDLLFNEIVLKEECSENSALKPQIHSKHKDKAVKKRPTKGNRKRNLHDSIHLFKDTLLRKKKVKENFNSKGATRNKEQCLGSPKIMDTLVSTDDTSESLILLQDPDDKYKSRNFVCQQKFNLKGDKSDLPCEEFDLEESIEIPRDIKGTWSGPSRLLGISPPVDLVPSDDECLITSPPPSTAKKEKILSDENWVTYSSDVHGARSVSTDTGSCRKSISSKFTYTYISTYTENSKSKTSCGERSSSPHVIFKKACPNLNSTTYWNKEDIGAIHFPDSISPIFKMPDVPKNELLKKNQEKWKSLRVHEKVEQEPKCSTQLFVSISSSQNKMFNSVSTIPEDSKTQGPQETFNPETTKTGYNVKGVFENSAELVPVSNKVDVVAPNKEVKSSTPHHGSTSVFTLDLSPIKSVHDEDELYIHSSKDVNSEEIIVPSLMQLSDLSEKVSLPKVNHEDQTYQVNQTQVEPAETMPVQLEIISEEDKQSVEVFHQIELIEHPHQTTAHITSDQDTSLCNSDKAMDSLKSHCDNVQTRVKPHEGCGQLIAHHDSVKVNERQNQQSFSKNKIIASPISRSVQNKNDSLDSNACQSTLQDQVTHQTEVIKVEDQTIFKDSVCATCFGHICSQGIYKLCLVGKLCAISQSILKRAQ